jgi:hypothetical protein
VRLLAAGSLLQEGNGTGNHSRCSEGPADNRRTAAIPYQEDSPGETFAAFVASETSGGRTACRLPCFEKIHPQEGRLIRGAVFVELSNPLNKQE